MMSKHRLMALAFATLAMVLSVSPVWSATPTNCDISKCMAACEAVCPPECTEPCEEICPMPCASECKAAKSATSAGGSTMYLGVLDPSGHSALRLFAGQNLAIQE